MSIAVRPGDKLHLPGGVVHVVQRSAQIKRVSQGAATRPIEQLLDTGEALWVRPHGHSAYQRFRVRIF